MLRDSVGHDFMTTRLMRPDDSIIFCDTYDEILERLSLTTTLKPAHLSIADAGAIFFDLALAPPLYDVILTECADTPSYENTLSVRPDWPEVAAALNQVLRDRILQQSIKQLLNENLDPRLKTLIS